MYTDVLPTAGVHSAAVAAPPAAQQQPHHAGDGLAFGSVFDARGGSTAAGAGVEVGGVCPGSSASDGGSAPAATSATGESAAAAHADAVAAPAAAAAAEVEQLPSPVAAGRGEGEASAAAAVHAVLDALVTAAERSEGEPAPSTQLALLPAAVICNCQGLAVWGLVPEAYPGLTTARSQLPGRVTPLLLLLAYFARDLAPHCNLVPQYTCFQAILVPEECRASTVHALRAQCMHVMGATGAVRAVCATGAMHAMGATGAVHATGAMHAMGATGAMAAMHAMGATGAMHAMGATGAAP
jgi:hypothetical protein